MRNQARVPCCCQEGTGLGSIARECEEKGAHKAKAAQASRGGESEEDLHNNHGIDIVWALAPRLARKSSEAQE